MVDKQPLNATFFAFRKRDKAVLLPATITVAVLAILVGGAFAALNWQGVVDYVNWAARMGQAPTTGAPPSMEAMMPPASVMSLYGSYFLFMLVYYVLLAAYEAACLRWMIRGEAPGLFGLTLGADTWRVYFTYWIWFLLLMAVYFVCFMVFGGVMLSMLALGQGQAPDASMGLAMVVLALVVLLAAIYVSVRFAPAAATSIARRRFAFFDAWAVTRGRFWALLGSFVLIFLMFFVFYIIAAFGLGMVMASLAMTQIGAAEPKTAEEAMRAFANPAIAGTLGGFVLVMIVASFVLYIAMFGVNARAAQAALEEGKIQAAS